jgi:hypothetical protein
MMPAGGDPAAVRSPMTGLMLAFAFTLPYHVMRTAAATGMRVHVLGGGAARGLKRSRCCRAYHEIGCAGGPETLLAEIERLVHDHAIDIVFPGDDVSTRLLSALGERLPARVVPLPHIATFDLLNDKWSFTRFCLDNGIRAPRAWLFDDIKEFRGAIESGAVALPVTVKPTNRSGGAGVIHIRKPSELGLIDTVDYQPILVQHHIIGETVSITALCEHGRIVAHVAQQRDTTMFRVFADPNLLATVAQLIALTGYHGTANFDAVISAADGLGYLVECNPRFWYSIYLVMIAGLNFAELVLDPPSASGSPLTLDSGHFRLSLRRILSRPWRANAFEWRYLRYCLGDPVPFTLLRARSYDDGEFAGPAETAAVDDRAPAPGAPRLALG